MSTTGNRFHVNNAALKSLQPIRDIMLNSRRENMTLHYEAFKLWHRSPQLTEELVLIFRLARCRLLDSICAAMQLLFKRWMHRE